MSFWLVAGGFVLAVAAVSWIIPTRLKLRWLLPFAALLVGVLLLTPRPTMLLPMIVCTNGTDCRLAGTNYGTLVGASVPGGGNLGYDGTLALAFGIALGTGVLSVVLLLYRARLARADRVVRPY